MAVSRGGIDPRHSPSRRGGSGRQPLKPVSLRATNGTAKTVLYKDQSTSNVGPIQSRVAVNVETLAFVAGGALLGVEIFRRNAEHVVTLNAYAMENGLSRRRRLVFGVVGLGLSGFVCHKRILSHPRASPNRRGLPRAGGIQTVAKEHLMGRSRSRPSAVVESFAARNFARIQGFSPAS